LLQNELYSGDDEKTKDELIIFFMAGNETVKTSTANTLMYLSMHDHVRARFLAEISDVLDSAASDFQELFTCDHADSFTYVRNCWHESMRLQSPAPNSFFNKFTRDVTIRGVTFTPTTGFIVNFDAIHKDPREWIQPEKYEPDRFDPNSPYYLRPDG
jgi:cytochrome P450